MKRRLLITAIGESTNRMIPPLILKKEHVDQAIDIMKKAVHAAVLSYQSENFRTA